LSYRGFSDEELEREYSPSSCLPGGDLAPVIERYIEQSADARRRLPVIEGVQYGVAESQYLDLFPAEDKAAPLHIFIHGGYWQQLSARESAVMAPALHKAGVSLAVVNYTLAPDASIGAMIEECRNAILYLRDRAAEMGFDPNRISASGHSAGAHLLAMVMAGDWPGENPVGKTIYISGIYDLEPIALTYVNEPLGLDSETAKALSPLKQDFHHECPALVIAGENETGEFQRQSKAWHEHLLGAGVASEFRLLNCNHFDIIQCDALINEIVARTYVPDQNDT